jgi:hypothetical protein
VGVDEHRELQDAAVAADAVAYRCLLAGDAAAARRSLLSAASLYRASWDAAPPGGYGRLVGMLKAAILADDATGAARFVLAALADHDSSPTAAYARALAYLVAGEDAAAGRQADVMREGGDAFARTAMAITALADGDAAQYAGALRAVVSDFEQRSLFLTGVAIADTALVLERLAAPRGLRQQLDSVLVPAVQ